jgi:hypothetical protein
LLTIRGVSDKAECAMEVRGFIQPDSTVSGWWCHVSWGDCRKEGAVTLGRDRQP